MALLNRCTRLLKFQSIHLICIRSFTKNVKPSLDSQSEYDKLKTLIATGNVTGFQDYCKTDNGKIWFNTYKNKLMKQAIDVENINLIRSFFDIAGKDNRTDILKQIGNGGKIKVFTYFNSYIGLSNKELNLIIESACKTGQLALIEHLHSLKKINDYETIKLVHKMALDYDQKMIIKFIEPYVFRYGKQYFEFMTQKYYVLSTKSSALLTGLNESVNGYELYTFDQLKETIGSLKYDADKMICQIQVPWADPGLKYWNKDNLIHVNKIMVLNKRILFSVETLESLQLPVNWKLVDQIVKNSSRPVVKEESKVEPAVVSEKEKTNKTDYLAGLIVLSSLALSLFGGPGLFLFVCLFWWGLMLFA
jgi:hypothetical protein